MRSTLRLFASLLLLVAATGALATQAEISGIDKIYLRSGPGSEEPAIAVLSAGDAVDILDIEGSWTKVQTTDGKVGYVYHRYVTPRVGEEGANPVATNPAPVVAAPAAATPKPAVPAAPQPAPQAPAPSAGVAAPAAEKPHGSELSSELATLRAEIADLKHKIQERQTELGEGTEPVGGASALESSTTPNEPIMTPSAAAPLSARDQAVGVLMIALFSLVIGWVLGSTFGGRRGPRSRSGGRLRF